MDNAINIQKEFFFPENNIEYIGLKNNLFTFSSDVWDCSKLVRNNLQGINKNNYIFDFTKIHENDLKIIIKKFTWILIAQDKVKIGTIALKVNIHFICIIYEFFKKNKIKSFMDIDNKLLHQYIEYLLSNKYYTPTFLATNVSVFIEICNTSFLYKLDNAVKSKIFLESSPHSYFNVTEYSNKSKNKDKSIPDLIFNSIISKANEINKYMVNTKGDILEEQKGLCKDLAKVNLVKYGILIQATTGLRISEVLTLKVDCLSIIDGRYWLTYTSAKTYKEAIYVKILISKLTYEIIIELIEITETYRQLLNDLKDDYSISIRNYIFLKSTNCGENYIVTPKSSGWTKDYLKSFIKKYNITYIDKNGENKLYHLHSHSFRHTFAKKLVNDGVPLRVIKEHYAHVSIDMTARYVALKHETIERDYIKTFIEAKTIHSNGNEGNLFKNIVEQITIENDINNVIDNLTKRFGINPLPMGLCIMDFKKGHCTHTGSEGCYFSNCKDFVTNSLFLDNFIKQRDLIIKEIDRIKDNKFANMTFKLNLRKKEKLDEIINSLTNNYEYKEGL